MIRDVELQRVLATQPYARIRRFAEELGWNGIRQLHVLLGENEARLASIASGIVLFYVTTDEKFNLQINPRDHGQSRLFRATVKACRYGITSIGWHDFELFADENLFRREVERLKPFLYRPYWRDRKWRYRLVKENPAMPGIIWSRRGKLKPIRR